METTQQTAAAPAGNAVQSWLDKIEFIRQRFPIGYRQARDVLEQAGGDLFEALAMLDDQVDGQPQGLPSTPGRAAADSAGGDDGDGGRTIGHTMGERLRQGVQQLWQDSTQTRIRVERGNHLVLDIPLVAGLAMGVFAPTLTLLSGLSALAADCRLSLERRAPSSFRKLEKLTSASRF